MTCLSLIVDAIFRRVGRSRLGRLVRRSFRNRDDAHNVVATSRRQNRRTCRETRRPFGLALTEREGAPMIAAVVVEQDWQLQQPVAPVYRAGAGRWVAALCVIVSAVVLVPAAASAPATKFVSKQYGYSIVLPGNSSRWFSSFARVTWSTGTISPDTPAFDTYTDQRTGRLYIIGARRLLAGSTLEKWTATFLRNRGPNCTTHSSLSNSKLSGAPAHLLMWSCTDGYNAIGITALHARLGYFMIVASRTDSSGASNRIAFSGARASFRFLSK
jgi:hypothetical protein